MSKPYDFADLKIASLKTEVSAEFQNTANVMPFDELNAANVKSKASDLFSRLRSYSVSIYKKAFIEAYKQAIKEAEDVGFTGLSDEKMSGLATALTLSLLSRYHPVTEYVFNNEVKRKRDRMVEAVMSATNRTAVREAFDKTARLWFRQARQYTDFSVDEARTQAFRDAGVTYVRWVTANDERVCAECNELDEEIFLIDGVPPKPHRGCRCYLIPVRSS